VDGELRGNMPLAERQVKFRLALGNLAAAPNGAADSGDPLPGSGVCPG